MPESREEEGSFFLFIDTFHTLKDKTSFGLIGLHADASNREQIQYHAQDGHERPDIETAISTSPSPSPQFGIISTLYEVFQCKPCRESIQQWDSIANGKNITISHVPASASAPKGCITLSSLSTQNYHPRHFHM